MYKIVPLLALVLLASCARPSKIDIFKEPKFNIRPLDDHAFAVTAKNVREILERLGCGVDTTCTVSSAGEVFVARTGPDTLLIQVPLKTIDQLVDDVGCGPYYICAVQHDGKVLVVKRKE